MDLGETMVIAAPTLVESYATLTRFPPPYRLSGATAWSLISETFGPPIEVFALDPAGVVALLSGASHRQILGGQIYDAVIVSCANVAQADVILTFNGRHFLPLVAPPTTVVVPGS